MTEQILELLTIYKGNVDRVAQELGISASYIHKVKREQWQAPLPERSLEPTKSAELTNPDELLKAVLAPNNEAVGSLRDNAIAELQARLESGQIADKSLVSLLRVVLSYETSSRALLKPTLVVNDNRKQNLYLGQLADQLSSLPLEKLSALSGVAPVEDVVEAEYTDNEDE